MSDCPDRAELALFISERLDDPATSRIVAHLATCAACRCTFDELSSSSKLLNPLSRLDDTPFTREPTLNEPRTSVREIGEESPAAGESHSRTPENSKSIHGYEILEKLGEGGMGAVYKARHTRLKKIVAIKMLRNDRLEDQHAVARFEREMEAVGKLEHPNLVRAMDAGEQDGMHYLVMEYVPGVDLSKLVARHGPLPIADACELIRQAALGLQSAHEHGLVHRDIKPSNLILSTSGTLKILDLGLALLGGESAWDGRELTDPGQMMGTLDYMSPEQGAGSKKVDIRADIYTLGATLYKLLTGQAPFGGEKYATPMQKLAALATEIPTPVQSLRAEVPPALAAVVTKMLARDPRSRYTTPSEVARAIQPFAKGNRLSQLLADLPSRAADGTSAHKVTTEKLSNSMAGTQGQKHGAVVSDPTWPSSTAFSPAATSDTTQPVGTRPGKTFRYRPASIAIAAGLLFLAAGGLYYGITILIKNKEGKVIGTVEIPEGTKAEIQQDGKKVAEVEAGKVGVVVLKPNADAGDAKLAVEELVDRVDDGVVLITALDAKGEEAGLGSGFVVGPGLIATNYHVIKEASEARVQLHDGMSYEVLGCRAIDPDADVAILELKEPPKKMTALTLRKADEPRPGSSVVAIGHPSGFRFSVTTGIVSAVHRTVDLPDPYREFVTAPPDHKWIQTSAPISPGNSGGPLLDEQGNVIGINTWVAGGTNLGFALHIRHVAALLDRLEPKVLSLQELAEPQQKLRAIVEDFQKQQRRIFQRGFEKGSPERVPKAAATNSLVTLAEQLLALADQYPNSPAALDALAMIFLFEEMSLNGEPEKDAPMPAAVYQRAGDRILAKHLGNPRLLRLVRSLGSTSNPHIWDVLRRISTAGPPSDLQGIAALSLARALHASGAPDGRFNQEIETLLTRVTAQHAQVKIEGKTLASHAAPLLAEIKESLIGRPAPPTSSKDIAGKEFSLGDYRGKVVALVFWNSSETAENSALNSTLRSLAEMRGGPSFVMLGVDGDDPPNADSTSNAAWWRSFQDGPDGPIARLWNVEEVPEFYVLDHEGMVRLRTFSLPLLSSAVEELLARMPSPKLTEAISVSSEQSLDEIVPGVTADRIVVWNQHNGGRNDRGTTAFNLRLFRHGKEVWKQEGIKLPWTAGEDTKVSIPLPALRFDRVRVEVEAWQAEGGGLSEIEVFQGERNLARGCPADASDYFDRTMAFRPARVTDGMTSSALDDVGIWLLPSMTKGWIDVDVAAPTPSDSKGTTADRVVLWNQFNPPHSDRGTTACTLRLLRLGKEVWSKADIAIPWEANQDRSATVELPKLEFDSVRVDVDTWHGPGGGLSEVQIFRGEENIALACPVIDSRSISEDFRAERAVDGIVRPRHQGIGYWLLPDGIAGWIEIDVSGVGTQIGAVRRRLGAQRCFLAGDPHRGARWMLRCDLLFLRQMARREQHQDLTLYDELSLAGGWWGLAQQAAGPAKEGILTMALKHYSGASRSDMGPAVDPLIQDRIRQALAVLPQRNYLYFKPEVSVEGVEHPEKLRTYHIKVDGTPSPFGLSAEPPAKGSSRVIFRLDSLYKRFEGGVGINDVAGESKTPLVFRILGDGKELWKSSPVNRPSERVNFDVDVAGVREITLVVDCPGENIGALASWLEPRLSE